MILFIRKIKALTVRAYQADLTFRFSLVERNVGEARDDDEVFVAGDDYHLAPLALQAHVV